MTTQTMKRSATLITTVALLVSGFITPAMALFPLRGSVSVPTISLSVHLTGTAEVPPVQTNGAGDASLTYNKQTHVLSWEVTYSNLSSALIRAAFHGPATAGSNAPVEVRMTEPRKRFNSPITGSTTLKGHQVQDFETGKMYINIDTKDHPKGEIRGQVP